MAGDVTRSERRLRAIATSAPALLLLLAASLSAAGDAAAQSLQDKIAACAACHGDDGRSKDPNIPSIGGQPKLFVMYQLFFYREGRRKSPEMNAVAKELSDAELDAVAEHVSRLPPPPPFSDTADVARLERGDAIARQRLCGTCHNPDYSGREQMPRVAGQHEPYLLKSFKEYQAGTRVGTQAAMAEAVRGLAEADLADLAYYLARFRP